MVHAHTRCVPSNWWRGRTRREGRVGGDADRCCASHSLLHHTRCVCGIRPVQRGTHWRGAPIRLTPPRRRRAAIQPWMRSWRGEGRHTRTPCSPTIASQDDLSCGTPLRRSTLGGCVCSLRRIPTRSCTRCARHRDPGPRLGARPLAIATDVARARQAKSSTETRRSTPRIRHRDSTRRRAQAHGASSGVTEPTPVRPTARTTAHHDTHRGSWVTCTTAEHASPYLHPSYAAVCSWSPAAALAPLRSSAQRPPRVRRRTRSPTAS
jgi:hypothetical protein